MVKKLQTFLLSKDKSSVKLIYVVMSGTTSWSSSCQSKLLIYDMIFASAIWSFFTRIVNFESTRLILTNTNYLITV